MSAVGNPNACEVCSRFCFCERLIDWPIECVSAPAAGTEAVRHFLQHVAPPLDGTAHKGQAGRVGVLGGSKDYTGAPYYSGQAALSVGADLLYLFTAEEACIPIKSYSPELMVRRRRQSH